MNLLLTLFYKKTLLLISFINVALFLVFQVDLVFPLEIMVMEGTHNTVPDQEDMDMGTVRPRAVFSVSKQ